MRPLKLVVQGIRSYRGRHEIDFTGKGLVAIVGKTGAGKSSLLEAIFFALFGGSTWDLRSAAALIADGEPLMRVELTFTSRGKTWQIRRVLFRSTTQARHELICVDDPTTRFDGKGAIDKQIKHLVGLDAKAFLKTILLPQGRFQALLHASDSERTPILKALLGLDVLDTIAREADNAYRRLGPPLRDLRETRSGLLDDPTRTAAERADALGKAHTRWRKLADTHTQITSLRERIGRQRQQAEDMTRQATNLEALRRPDASARFRQLGVDQHKYLQLLKDQQTAAQGTELLHAHVEALIEDAERAGVGLARSVEVAGELASAKRRVADLQDRGQEIAEQTDALAAAAAQIPGWETRSQADAKAAQAAHDAHADAAKKFEKARETLETVRAALAEVRADQAAAAQFAVVEPDKAAAATQARQEAKDAEEAAGQERAKAKIADAEHESAIRANAAAHVAATCTPGQPCPVCRQPVPVTFVVPEPPDEHALGAAKTAAQRRATRAATLHARLQTRAEELERELEALRQAEHAVQAERAARVHALARLVGSFDDGMDDDAILESYTAAVTTLEQDVQTAREREIATRVTAETTARELATLQSQMTKTRTDLAATGTKLDNAWAELRSDLAALHLGIDFTSDITNSLLNEGIATAHARQAAARDLANDLTNTQETLQDQQLELQRLRTVVAAEVDSPTQALTTALTALATALANAAGEAISREGLEVPEALDAKAAWAEALDAHVEDAVRASRRAIQAADTAAAQAHTTEIELLAAVDVPDMKTLADTSSDALADVKVLERGLAEAQRQIPIVADLARRISTLEPLVEALDDVTMLMTNSNFPAAAIEQRQVRFLELATDRLLEMTDHKFGFAEDFSIVDASASQARDTKTLSGGETFLASLALALAVVDLAGRAGGHVDAFFLDEGFGSLDHDALRQALDTLAQQTLGGQLVAVISHMAAVVEEIDDVLLVNRTPTGSSAAWASAEERKQLAEAEYQDLFA